MASPPAPVPVPKPRSRYVRDALSSQDGDQPGDKLSNGTQSKKGEEAPPPAPAGSDHGAVFPTLAGITDIIANNIPSLAGFASSIGGSAPTSSTLPPPTAPPLMNSMANSAAPTPQSVSTATTVPDANASSVSLEKIVSSLANLPSFTGFISNVTDPTVSSTVTQTTPSASQTAGSNHKDVGAFSQLVTLNQDSGVVVPPQDDPTDSKDEATLASWASQEEPDIDSSNEEDDTRINPDGTMEGEPPSYLEASTNISSNSPGRMVPLRPAPPPPPARSAKSAKRKIPRMASIRVSRKKGGSGNSSPRGAVVQSSWLDIWKGFRYNVLWTRLEGQLMSLWKKRTDHFSELLFHVSSITNLKKQDKRRFSIYFKKKRYDFMAHSEEVYDGWVTSLLVSRGQPSPPPPELHGQIMMKDTRSRAYAAMWGHDLWIYPNKEGFQLGVASFSVPLNVATVKSIGKHSFTLITPFKTFNISVDSSKDLSNWLDNLSSTISSALSSGQVVTRLWENPDNKLCGDCGSANPEWASVNLLLVICQNCAGQHRALGAKLSKVRSLKMDNKVWTEPLIQLFVTYGNRLANQVWAPAVPTVEKLQADSSDEERSKFIQKKYSRGCYRRVHALAYSQSLMDQRLHVVVCGDNIEETMSLICSGAKVCPTDPQHPSAITLAEKSGQALQTELLRLNEFTEVPPYQPQLANRRSDVTFLDEEEELHGKLEEDRFLFSLENNSAVCDVLDLREVLSVFLNEGPGHEFELVTLSDQIICTADHQEAMQSHLVYILKVILPSGVSYAEVGGASAVSKVCVFEVGGASHQTDAWLLLWEDGVSVHPLVSGPERMMMDLSKITSHQMEPSKNTITLVTADRCVSFRFEEQRSCKSWFKRLKKALANQNAASSCPPPTSHRSPARQSLYPAIDVISGGSAPQAIERCISHVTNYGLKIEGVYRRCGLVTKVHELVKILTVSPMSAPLEHDEQGVLDAASALKLYIRQQESLIPDTERQQWLHAAVISDEQKRFSAYHRLIQQLPGDSRATLNALFGHFYLVQMFSQENKMSAHNLAVVLVPTLFQSMSQDLLKLTREFIIHHTLLFLMPKGDVTVEPEEQITAF
ncbi:arf-GAP with Rho-GAP domain, ANK repeat and PH domain-containing protein 1 isoform X2 [Takifugu rubripes]|uniref:Arf-GAP with Rho-GAP domain, ANK repeat and PH domain-containing protein 1-like n=1 Tax=Takifugu rubripes TaxID=31033 RepID=A0A3B5KQL3_TAKRU|nr:arf-GAP with Rho-GAP domain, ANK repeat and PH domain-containing protein 1-like isoform X2 [Takifugu rubripes]